MKHYEGWDDISKEGDGYAIQVQQVVKEGESFFKATSSELPHLVTYESTAQKAYDVLIEDIEVLYSLSKKMGHTFPNLSRESSVVFA